MLCNVRGVITRRTLVLLVLFGVFVGVLGTVRFGWVPATQAERAQPQPIAASAPTTAPLAVSSAASELEGAFVQAASRVGPAVVSISTEQTARVQRMPSPFRRSPFGGMDPFEQFFRDFFEEMPEQELRRSGLGSGVLIDPRGYILTNEHVVSGADRITVTLPDGREFAGETKGTDPRSDLAVVKIDAKELPAAALGDSTQVKIGQWAIAIGNPFGFIVRNPEPTITVGVISALHRDLPRTSHRDRNYTDLIQTDAAINPGNSGGPLINLRGEVIGINVAIFSTSGGSEGIGFAIPANRARDIVAQLIEGKKIVYGWLGVQIQDLTADVATYYGLEQSQGALVYQVVPDSPAASAGFKEGDVIRSFDGHPVASSRDLVDRVGTTPVGKRVAVEVLRNRQTVKLQVQVSERPGDLDELSAATKRVRRWRGLTLSEFTEDAARALGLPPMAQPEGVIVMEIEPSSPAALARLRSGDVVNGINHQSVRTLPEFDQASRSCQGDCLVRTMRGYFVVPSSVE